MDDEENQTTDTPPTLEECEADPEIEGCDEVLNPEPTIEELCAENPELDICPPTAEECEAALEANETLEGCPPTEEECLLDPELEGCPITAAECLADPDLEECPSWEECE